MVDFASRLTVSLLERQIHQPVSSPRSPEPAVKSPDLSFYVQIAENAKKRAEVLGRENLEVSLLQVEIKLRH